MEEFKNINYESIIQSLLGQLSQANLKIAKLESQLQEYLKPKYNKANEDN